MRLFRTGALATEEWLKITGTVLSSDWQAKLADAAQALRIGKEGCVAWKVLSLNCSIVLCIS